MPYKWVRRIQVNFFNKPLKTKRGLVLEYRTMGANSHLKALFHRPPLEAHTKDWTQIGKLEQASQAWSTGTVAEA